MRRTLLALVSGLVIAAPLAAQQPDSATERARQRIEAILSIPRRTDEARRSGVPDSTLRTVLDILVRQRVPAEEAATILETESAAAAEHGPTDNLGAFVQAQLAAGKRGRELAAAIRAEHAAHGKGRPAGAGRGSEKRDARLTDDRGGRPEDAARGGRPEGAGQSGRPAGAGAAAGKRADSAASKRPVKKPH